MNALRIFGLASIFAASFTLVACDGQGGLASKSPQERVDAVQSAISDPSGQVNKDSVQVVLDVAASQAKFEAMSDFLQSVPGLYGGQVDAKCVSGSSADGSVDLSCSSGGKASGKVSYKVETKVSGAGANVLVEMKFEDVCEDSTCIDGSMVVGVESSQTGASTVMQASLDMKAGSESTHGEWGIEVKSSEAGSSVNIAVFDDAGDSYVLSTEVTAESASVSIKGANGEFSCSYDAGGASGSCTGAGEFSW